MNASIDIVGCNQYDPKGKEKLHALLAALSPNVIFIEATRSAINRAAKYQETVRSLTHNALKNNLSKFTENGVRYDWEHVRAVVEGSAYQLLVPQEWKGERNTHIKGLLEEKEEPEVGLGGIEEQLAFFRRVLTSSRDTVQTMVDMNYIDIAMRKEEASEAMQKYRSKLARQIVRILSDDKRAQGEVVVLASLETTHGSHPNLERYINAADTVGRHKVTSTTLFRNNLGVNTRRRATYLPPETH